MNRNLQYSKYISIYILHCTCWSGSSRIRITSQSYARAPSLPTQHSTTQWVWCMGMGLEYECYIAIHTATHRARAHTSLSSFSIWLNTLALSFSAFFFFAFSRSRFFFLDDAYSSVNLIYSSCSAVSLCHSAFMRARCIRLCLFHSFDILVSYYVISSRCLTEFWWTTNTHHSSQPLSILTHIYFTSFDAWNYRSKNCALTVQCSSHVAPSI